MPPFQVIPSCFRWGSRSPVQVLGSCLTIAGMTVICPPEYRQSKLTFILKIDSLPSSILI